MISRNRRRLHFQSDGKRRWVGFDIPLAPPVMPLHCEAPLRSASPFRNTTYTRTGGFCLSKSQLPRPGGTQNPPVLWLTESACSCPEQPLSATHGRQRYNTLDFSRKVVCHGGCYPPLDASRQGSSAAFGNHCQGYSVPFGFPSQQGALAPIGNPEPKELLSLWNPSPF